MTLAVQSRSPATRAVRPSPKGGAVADPYGITRRLMDGALERLDAARGHLKNGDITAKHSFLKSVLMIVAELRAHLDLSGGHAIAANVDDLYDYMCRRLRAADLEKNGIATLYEVSHLLDALRSAWAYLPAEVRSAARN